MKKCFLYANKNEEEKKDIDDLLRDNPTVHPLGWLNWFLQTDGPLSNSSMFSPFATPGIKGYVDLLSWDPGNFVRAPGMSNKQCFEDWVHRDLVDTATRTHGVAWNPHLPLYLVVSMPDVPSGVLTEFINFMDEDFTFKNHLDQAYKYKIASICCNNYRQADLDAYRYGTRYTYQTIIPAPNSPRESNINWVRINSRDATQDFEAKNTLKEFFQGPTPDGRRFVPSVVIFERIN